MSFSSSSRPILIRARLTRSRERVSRALISMGRDELEKLIAEQHGAELTCQFCDRVYQFTEEELQSLLDEATKK